MEHPTSFGAWLKQRRKALDLTQAELGSRVGCAMMTIQKIEAEARRPSKIMAERLAGALEIADAERAAFLHLACADLATDRIPPSAAAPPLSFPGTMDLPLAQ